MVLTAALYPPPSSLYRKETPENITWGRGTLRSAGIHGAVPNVGSFSCGASPSWGGGGNYKEETKKGRKIKGNKEGVDREVNIGIIPEICCLPLGLLESHLGNFKCISKTSISLYLLS